MSDGEDDDWFESALRDEEGPEQSDVDEESPEQRDADEESSAAGRADGQSDNGDSPFDDDSGTPFENEGSSESPFDSEGSSDSPFDDDSDSPFEDDSDSPFDDDSDSPFDDDSDSPFDDGTDGSDTGTGTGNGDGESLFGDDFASAFESAGGGGGEAEFEDEDFDSDIPRIDVGIEGLDQMIQGGIPQRHLMVAIGSAGTGKTTFGLQFLNHGLQQGDNCVFITLEQSHDAIIDTANEWGWEFDEYEADNQLAVIDLDPVEMANSLDNIRGELPGLIEDFDADRLVLDSVSLLEMMYDNPAKRRTEVFDFTRSLKNAGVTTMLTSEASEDNPYASRHGIIEYLTDAVFILQYVRSETRETRLAVEIQKIRNANHSRETKPYEITMEGISVYQQANIF